VGQKLYWEEKERAKKLQRMENKETESYGAKEKGESEARKKAKQREEKKKN